MLDRLFSKKTTLVDPADALPGRDHYAFALPTTHAVNGQPIQPPFADGLELAYFALGCFWGAERLFWQLDGVVSTFVGYMGGTTPYPTYREVCTGQTNHAETVGVVYDPRGITYTQLVKAFFEAHDPTQGMRQGNDVGSQYRSVIFVTSTDQRAVAESMARQYGQGLEKAGYGPLTTDIAPAGPFYYAEDDHQQYLHKVPNGYCGLAGTGVTCAIPGQSAVKLEKPTA